jgi:gp16 family phage-associated protein
MPASSHESNRTVLRTGSQALADFRSNGQEIASWARSKGFNPRIVYLVLTGNRKCVRGESFEIAKALGMK